MADIEVRAGGGLVADAQGRVLVVHRPRYDDWTFPKGKLDAGETLAECALREVLEEAGCVCELGEQVATIRYQDQYGRLKEVTYWWMTPLEVAFAPNDEVDEIRWVEPRDLATWLTYQRDLEVLDLAFGAA